MQFQNPWGALALLLLLPLILLYLLKQRHQDVEVPSVALWSQVLSQWEAAHPWQKWRRNLLFFLQMLAICLLALALMRPVWRTSGAGQNNIILLDVSMSMQAVEQGRSRLDRAKDGIRGLVEQMNRGEEVTLILSGRQNEALVSRSRDRDAVLGLLDQVEAQNGGNKLDSALQMAQSMLDTENNEMIHIFTDNSATIPGEGAALHNVALGVDNVAVTGVSYSRNSRDASLNILGLLHNFGPAGTVNVELWGDGQLLDVRECTLESGSPGNVIFDGVDAALQHVSLAVSEEDALTADNRGYCVVQDDAKYKVLLQTERNVFLEKAILLRDDIELYKTSPQASTLGEYDLFIGDSWAGGELPEGQSLWAIAPQNENKWFALQQLEEGGLKVSNSANGGTLLRYVDLSGLRVAKTSGFVVKDPATSILATMGGEPVIIYQDEGGVKRLAFGFDFHDSNLPLQKDFPILVQNVLEWFLPRKEGQVAQTTAGEAVSVSLLGSAATYDVGLPDGSSLQGLSQRQFDQTRQLGFYSVIQYDGDGGEISRGGFAVNPPVQQESELRTAGSQEQGQAAVGELWRRWNLWPYLILCTLILMAVEWWVYHRGA